MLSNNSHSTASIWDLAKLTCLTSALIHQSRRLNSQKSIKLMTHNKKRPHQPIFSVLIHLHYLLSNLLSNLLSSLNHLIRLIYQTSSRSSSLYKKCLISICMHHLCQLVTPIINRHQQIFSISDSITSKKK